jgi:ABC-type transport system involved in multi-copper enzyme maturation permease subunit
LKRRGRKNRDDLDNDLLDPEDEEEMQQEQETRKEQMPELSEEELAADMDELMLHNKFPDQEPPAPEPEPKPGPSWEKKEQPLPPPPPVEEPSSQEELPAPMPQPEQESAPQEQAGIDLPAPPIEEAPPQELPGGELPPPPPPPPPLEESKPEPEVASTEDLPPPPDGVTTTPVGGMDLMEDDMHVDIPAGDGVDAFEDEDTSLESLPELRRKAMEKKKASFFKSSVHVVFLKTFFNIGSFGKSIGFLIGACMVPAIVGFVMGSIGFMDISEMSVEAQTAFLSDIYLFLVFLWISGLVLAFSAAGKVSGFISKEVSKGTLLILISKPIRRIELLLGKFAAYVVHMMILQALALTISAYLLVFAAGGHIMVFYELAGLVPSLLKYSLFVVMIFGAIPLALSTIAKGSGRVMITMSLLIIFIYLGFVMVRSMFAGQYVALGLYNYDLGYHMGNVFVRFVEGSGVHLGPIFQMIMSTFAGTYEVGLAFENDQGFLLSAPLSGYYTTTQSLLVWTLIPVGLVLLSILTMQRKEIS